MKCCDTQYLGVGPGRLSPVSGYVLPIAALNIMRPSKCFYACLVERVVLHVDSPYQQETLALGVNSVQLFNPDIVRNNQDLFV